MWAHGALYTASSPIHVGDETWLYFTGSLDRHGWCGRDITYKEWAATVSEQGGWARIGLANRAAISSTGTHKRNLAGSGRCGSLFIFGLLVVDNVETAGPVCALSENT